jgi:tetratricopeptide (TPR) repeat protein
MSNLKFARIFTLVIAGVVEHSEIATAGPVFRPIPPINGGLMNVPAPNPYRPKSGGSRNFPAQPRNSNTGNSRTIFDYAASADLKYKKEDFQGALADLNQAIQLKPTDATAHAYYMRGLLKNDKLGDRSGGIADVKQAARLFKNQKDDVASYRSAILQLKAWGATTTDCTNDFGFLSDTSC